MKLNYILILFLVCSFSTFSQTEILDSVRNVQLKKNTELGVSLCTPGYWNADSEGGKSGFRQISEWPEELELKLFKEQKNENRAVLTVDIYFKGTPRDRIYMFLVKKSDSWLIDGIHETEELIPHFLEGYYSGHFTPFDLPRDTEMEEFGKKIISFGGNHNELLIYLEEHTASGSTFDFISELKTDENYEPYFLNTYGFDERINRGYINLWAYDKYAKDINYSDITIYVARAENGKIKILSQSIYGPSKSDFLSIK